MKKQQHTIRLPLPSEKESLKPSQIASLLDIPKNVRADFVALVYLSQPRGSSTATGAAWGALPVLKGKVHFQPFKYLQRYSKKLDIKKLRLFEAADTYAAIKETPGGPNHMAELFDPVAILIEAGLPAKHIRAVVAARHPFAQLESWLKFDTTRRAEVFLEGQEYVLGRVEEYKKRGIIVIPFAVELFYGMGRVAMQALFNALQLDRKTFVLGDSLRFDNPPTDVVWHEADPRIDPHYFDTVVAEVVKKGEFKLPLPKAVDTYPYVEKYIDQKLQKRLWQEAMPRYIAYAEHAAKFLKKEAGFVNTWFEKTYLPELKKEMKKHGGTS